jgi:hypothetical protein
MQFLDIYQATYLSADHLKRRDGRHCEETGTVNYLPLAERQTQLSILLGFDYSFPNTCSTFSIAQATLEIQFFHQQNPSTEATLLFHQILETRLASAY